MYVNSSLKWGFEPVAEAALDAPQGIAFLRALWLGKWLIAAVAALTIGLGLLYVLKLADPVYRATSVVMLEPRDEKVVELGSVISGLGRDEKIINSEVEVIRSRNIVGRLVVRLGLTDNPEFNPSLREAPLFDPKARIRGLLEEQGWLEPQPVVTPDEQKQFEATVSRVIEALNVRILPSSLVFSITATSGDAELAAQIANTLADIYILDQLETKFAATEEATAWLGGRVTELQAELEAAEGRVKAFEARNEFATPEALDAKERQLAAVRARIEQGAELASEAERLEAEYESLSAQLVKLEQLKRQASTSGLLYQTFLTRLKETSVHQGVQQADSRILSRAAVPVGPFWPNPPLVLALSGMLGLFLGSALILFREMRQTTFRTSSEIEAMTGYPVLGSIPQIGRRQGPPLDHVAKNPSSPLAEAVRNLRTSILLSDPDTPPRVIMVTSSVPDEGKSAAALMLAQNLAAMGRSVLMVEADIRRPVCAEMFSRRGHEGLLSLLSESTTPAEAIFRPEGMQFDMLVGENATTNAADLFSHYRFERFLEIMREQYDHIVIDTAPVLVVPDARVIAPRTDAVLYAVQWDRTDRALVRRGLKMFESLRIGISGLVLTRVNERRMEQYGSGAPYGEYAGQAAYYRN